MEEKSPQLQSGGVRRSSRGSPADLQQAIRAKDSSAIHRLVSESKVNINEAVLGTTPLSLAVYKEYVETVQQLIDLGANVNKISRDHNDRLEPPLCSACRLGSEPLVKILLLASADMNKTDFYNQSPLLLATRGRRFDLVQTLLENGAKVNIARSWSECPLYLACKYLGFKGRHEIVRLLICSGINLNTSDNRGQTPLYWAFKNLDKEISRTLILCGAGIQPLTWPVIDKELGRDFKEDDKFYEWLKLELNSPFPLQRLCLRFIRNHLCSDSAADFKSKIKLLPLPNTLIRYVSLDFLVQNDFSKEGLQ